MIDAVDVAVLDDGGAVDRADRLGLVALPENAGTGLGGVEFQACGDEADAASEEVVAFQAWAHDGHAVIRGEWFGPEFLAGFGIVADDLVGVPVDELASGADGVDGWWAVALLLGGA